ncbi:MAG: GPW/gp25 family protein [Candidatus Thorarchaeota archaeon]
MFDPSVTTLEKVKSQLYVLLFTSKGERAMLPSFGVEVYSSLFENFSRRLP